MEIVAQSQPFGMNYTAYDQNAGLFVAFNIYDVTTGTAVFVTQVIGQYANFGAYAAAYTGSIGHTYLVIGLVYLSNAYTTPDSSRPPGANLYQVTFTKVLSLNFAYAAYDQNATLDVQASIYNLTSGAPVFVENIVMSYVAYGVYFASFTGTLGQTYQAIGVVYTNGTYSTPDLTRAPSSDEFDSITLVPSYIALAAPVSLQGQSLAANLIGQSLAAILEET